MPHPTIASLLKFDMPLKSNSVCKLFGIEFPLLQAGMGGVASPELAAAVANTGCGGIVALYKQSPAEIVLSLHQTRSKTARIFGVNLIPEIVSDATLREQVNAVLAFPDKNIFFTFFGLPPRNILQGVKAGGRLSAVQVGTVMDATEALDRGADVLILQGREAGGHHLGENSTMGLLHQVRSTLPRSTIIVSGGIASGEDLCKFMASGADGCLCGTLFVASMESNAHEQYKMRIVSGKSSDTVITDRFEFGWPGRRHRTLKNIATEAKEKLPSHFIAQMVINNNSYPIPRYSSVVPTATTTGKIDEMVMYCGTSCESVTEIKPVSVIVSQFKSQFTAAISSVLI